MGAVIRLAWKGELPQTAHEALAALPQDLVVHVVEARFSLVELLDAAEGLIGRKALVPETGQVVSVGPRADGSGLDVEVLVPDVGAESDQPAPADVVLPTPVPYRVELVTEVPRAICGSGEQPVTR